MTTISPLRRLAAAVVLVLLAGCGRGSPATSVDDATPGRPAHGEAGRVLAELPSARESLDHESMDGESLPEPFHPTDEPTVRWRAELRATDPGPGEPSLLRVDEFVQSGVDFRITTAVDGDLVMEQLGSGPDFWMRSPLWEHRLGRDVWAHIDFADPAQARLATERIQVPNAGLINWWPAEVGESRRAPVPGASGIVTAVDRSDPRRTVIDVGDALQLVITRETVAQPRPVDAPTDRPIVRLPELDELASG